MYTLSVFFLCVNAVVLKHEPLTVEWKGKPLHSDGTMWTNKGQRSGVPGASL